MVSIMKDDRKKESLWLDISLPPFQHVPGFSMVQAAGKIVTVTPLIPMAVTLSTVPACVTRGLKEIGVKMVSHENYYHLDVWY